MSGGELSNEDKAKLKNTDKKFKYSIYEQATKDCPYC